MPQPLSHEFRVRYGECDPQGVVFNAHYLAYFDIGITELWRAAFGSYAVMTERGIDVVVAEARVRFRASARFDDLLRLEVGVTRLGNTSITTQHRIYREETLIVEGDLRHVVVEFPALVKTGIPDWLRGDLERFAIQPAADAGA